MCLYARARARTMHPQKVGGFVFFFSGGRDFLRLIRVPALRARSSAAQDAGALCAVQRGVAQMLELVAHTDVKSGWRAASIKAQRHITACAVRGWQAWSQVRVCQGSQKEVGGQSSRLEGGPVFPEEERAAKGHIPACDYR